MERMKRALSMLLAVIMVISVCPISAFATSSEEVSDEDGRIAEADMSVSGSGMPEEDELEEDNAVYSYGDYQYTILADGTISICGYSGVPQNGEEGIHLEIPSSIDGIQISQIAEEAFAYNEYICAVMIPESVNSVGNAAFYHCAALRAIAFCGTCPTLGTTVAEGSHALERVFALKGSNIAMFCALLVNDLGEDGARSVEIAEYDDLPSLKAAFNDYRNSPAEDIQNEENIPASNEEEIPASGDDGMAVIAGEDTPASDNIAAEEDSQNEENIPASNEEEIPAPGDDGMAVIAEEDTPASDNIAAEGSCGENLTWTLTNEGVLTISGTGAMDSYSWGTAPWYSYADSITSLVLSDDITTIGSCAFHECSGITGDLIIPDSVTSIGYYAFSGCSGFNGTLTLSENLTSIPDDAFYNCSNITGDLVIPDTVTEIGGSAFQNCSKLTGLELGNGITSIGSYAFYGCGGMTGDLNIPDSVTSIGDHAFFECSGMTGDLIIPDSVTSIGSGAFFGCSGFDGTLTLSKNLTSIPYDAFSNCSNIAGDLIIPDSVTSIGDSAFSGCTGMTGGLIIPSTVTSIGSSAFSGCTGMTGGLTIPSAVTSIGSCAFYGCGGMTGDLIIPDSVTSIGDGAFQGCSGFNGTLTLSKNLTSIPYGAFSDCSNITGDLVIPDTVTEIGAYAFQNCRKLTGLELGNGITGIGSYAFYGCGDMTGDLNIPDSVTSIDYYAFSGCIGMTGDLNIPDSVTSIGDSAFSGCSGFNGTLTLSKNLTSIPEWAFYECSNVMGDLVIPDSVTAIGGNAFYNMEGITSVVFGESMETLGQYAFSGCSNVTEVTFKNLTVATISDSSYSPFLSMDKLETIYVPADAYSAYAEAYQSYIPSTARLRSIGATDDFQIDDGVLTAYFGNGGEVVIPNVVTEIGTSAFQNCTTLTKVAIPESVTKIGDYAFEGCTGLTGLTLPSSLTTIGSYAFSGCTGMTGDLIIPDSVTSIGDHAFFECSGMTGDLIIPDSVTSIGDYAFSECSGFNGTLTLSKDLTSIPDEAFYFCSNVTGDLVIPDGVTTIGNNAFCNMKGITSVVFGESVESHGYLAFYFCSNVTEVTFKNLTVAPISSSDHSPFMSMDKLETIYVPADAYSAYAEAYQSYIPSTAKLKSIGAADDFQINDGVLTAYSGNGGEVVIPDGVTEIGTSAFRNCTTLTKVTIPESVTRIGEYAFEGCTNLTDMALPSALTTIGSYAFSGCTGMTGDLIVPDSVTSIGNCAFSGCSGFNGTLTLSKNLTSIPYDAFYYCSNITGDLVIPDSVTSIGDGAFSGCSGMTGGLTIPSAVTSIGSYAFSDCTGLDGKLVIEAGTKTIGGSAFQNCSKLTGLELGDGITSIDSYAFYGCSGMTGDLIIPDSVTSIDNSAFSECSGMTGDLIIPDSVTSIGSYAFSGSGMTGDLIIPDSVTSIGDHAFFECSGMTGDLIIPDSVTNIGDSAFSGCSGFNGTLTLSENLTSIPADAFYDCSNVTGDLVIPDSVTAIGSNAFYNMEGVTSVVFGESMKTLGQYAFYGCSSVTEVTFKNLTVATISGSNCPFMSMDKLETIYVPADAYSAYAEAYQSYIPSTARLKSIGAADDFQINDGVLTAYFGNGGEVVIPDGVTEIGTSAFQNCTTLTKVAIPESVTKIGDYAFEGCTGMTGDLIIPDSVTTIGNSAFCNMKGITSVVFGESMETLGQYAFSGCSNVTEVTFKNLTVAPISSSDYSPFMSMDKLETIYVPADAYSAYAEAYQSYIPSTAKLKSIGAADDFQINDGVLTAYSGNGGEVVIPDTVTEIGAAAFQNCTALTKVTIPESVTTIGYYAFDGCTSLTDIALPSALTTIGSYAFSGCTGMTGDLIVPDSVTSIGRGAFSGCSGFNGTLTLSKNLTSIPYGAFYHCSNITGDLVIPDSVTSIGDDAFRGCSGFDGTLTLSENLTSIPEDAFYNCSNVTGDLVIPDSVTAIGNNAFYNCSNITGDLVIPDSVTTIGSSAFYNMEGLTSVVFGESTKTLGRYAFESCSNVTEVTFKNLTVATISGSSYSPFKSMNKLETIYVPAGAYSAYAEAYQSYIPSTARFKSIGAADDFQIDDGVLTAYFGNGGEVVIPDTVTEIGASAFLNCTTLTKVAIPESVTKIGDYAFKGCTGLTGLTLPSSLTAIGSYAFSGCTGMTGDLNIPDSVTSIGDRVFYGCSGFNGTLTLSKNLTSIPYEAFSNCSNITGDLVIPDSVTVIGGDAFYNMKGITSVVFGESMESHGYDAFYGCSNVTEVTFKNLTVATISDRYSPFKSMDKLETIYVPADAYSAYAEAYQASIPSTARFKSIGAADDFQIDAGVLTAYFGNGGEVVIPDGVTEIGTSAFQNCTTLTKVAIPESVTKIGDYAFEGCTGLTGLTLPSSLTTIGSYAFSGCTGLDGKLVIETGTKTIGAYAFQNCTALTKVTIPESVTKIGDYAFEGCTGLTGLTLPPSLTTIGNYAFLDCTGMSGDLIIPDSVTSIGSGAFSGCSGFNGTLTLSKNLTSIPYDAFYYCSNITGDLVIPDSVTSIGGSAFSGCSGFNGTLTLSKNLTSIPHDAFYNCSNVTGDLVIPDSVTAIGSDAFYNMKGITSVVFGESMESHGYDAFYGCSNVTEVTFKNLTVATISGGYSPFMSMDKLETIYVPADAYSAYVEAYTKCVSDSVVFSTDFISAKVLNFRAEKVYSKTVVLSWNPHISDSVEGYTISRDGETLGTTAECTFADRELTTGTSYTYSVRGYTNDGTVTPATEITVTPVDPRILDIKTSSSQNKLNDDHNTVYIHVSNDKNLQPLGEEKTTGKLYYVRNGTEILIGTTALSPTLGSASTGIYTFDWDISALEDGEYTLKFVLTDIDGSTATYSGNASIDRSVPEQIVGVTAVGDVQKIYLSWAISSEADTNIYHIYRRAESDEAFRLVARINNRNTLTYTDTNVKTDRTYYYYVAGVNEFGQEGGKSEIAGATLSSDTEAPTVTKLTPANASYLTGTVDLSLTAEDNVSVVKAALYYSIDNRATWTLIAEINGGRFNTTLDTTAIRDGVIHIKGVACDAAGNESSALVYVYSIDNTGPEQVTGLAYESTDVTITLSWDNVADNDIRYYRVERKNTDGSYSTVSDVYSTLGLNIYDLTPETEYTYRVVGYDAHGNRGVPSEDITAKTISDTTAPVVTRIRPTSGYYSSAIDLSITATDEHSVAKIVIQTATDGVTWNTVYSKAYPDTSNSRTLAYTLDLCNYEEGYLFVRAIATDAAGNESDSSDSAPFVQHMVDKTAPAAPENVTAVGNIGYIEISWTQGSETDLGKYAVYRSESEAGTYELVKSGIAAINCIDRNVKEGVVYYYKVAVNDTAGNYSGYSDVVSAEVLKDTEAPVIVSIYPESTSQIGAGYKTVSVLATDNNALDTLVIEYSQDGQVYSELYRMTNINAYSKTVTATIPVAEFADGATVHIRAYATDKAGNQSAASEAEYLVDAVAPAARTANAVYIDESVRISWMSNLEDDLIGYRIYRKTGTTGSYSLISQRQAVVGQKNYFCYDYNLSIEKTAYIYKVEAVDACGNVSSIVTDVVDIPDRSAPKAVISCDSTMEVGVEYYIDASSSTDNSAIVSFLFDFGDGTTSTDIKPTHIYNKTGEYTITLTVTDDDGNQTVCTKEVSVKDRTVLGTAKIRVVDENGVAVAGAPVYFDLGEETQVIKATDSNGFATFTAKVGKHTVGCVIANNNWLPAKKDIIVVSNQETFASLTLVHHVMIEGQFEITRMTFEEIVAAGIDVSKPENQHMVKVNVTLTYGVDKVETSFTYNEITGRTIAKPTVVTTPDGQKRQIVPVVLSTNKGIGSLGDYEFSHEATIAYLDIPVGVSSLKEFFNVNLHIINNAASEFSIVDNVITLNVPDGLTLVDSYISESNSMVTIAEIKGQTTETITWILRGDQAGEYYLSADYSGVLSEFNEPIYTQFVATEPIEVYGLSNLKLKIEIPDELDHGTFYYNVSLDNEGKLDVYRPNIDTGDTLIETQLFDATGADITDRIALDAEDINKLGIATSIFGILDVLPAGYRFTKHYMCVDQTAYTEQKMKLKEYAYEIQNTYGLDIEIVTQPVSYFKSNLSANINAADKAALTLTTNQSAFDYLMANENYIYWSMYASTGAVSTALTTEGQETLWELLKFAAGSGDFKALFGADDEELIQAIILDAMELSVKSDDYSKYYHICDWTTIVKDWVKKEGYPEWINTVTKWINKTAAGAAEETIAKMIEDFGNSLPRTFEVIEAEYKWEAYKAIYEGEYLDFDNFIYTKWKMVIEEYDSEYTLTLSETDSSQMLHELFSKESFSTVWEAVGVGLDAAKKIVSACKNTATDISLYFVAQSNLDSCNLFLDTLSNYMYDSSSDANKVAIAATKIKQKMNEFDPAGRLAENLLDEAFWKAVDYGKDSAIKKLDITPNAYVKAIKYALKLTIYVGNNVFNVDDRYKIADNIRFVSCMTTALRYGIWEAQNGYQNERTDETAKTYMQLVSYLLNIRAIGESQVAQFGISYEVLPGIFDSADLFYAVRDMSGATGTKSWIEWRDFVEDKISLLRVQLLKNPVSTSASGTTAPTVTFNYATGQTAQTFTNEYEYSLDGGATWTTCNGSAIAVTPQACSMRLLVRRIDHSDSSEKLTGAVTIYAAPSLSGSGIRVLETEDGYRVENLNNNRKYEVTFSQNAVSYKYGDSLTTAIPNGSYSFKYKTSGTYDYVYIRSVADAERYASYVFMPQIYPMSDVVVTREGQGVVSGTGSYEYGAEATLVATAANGYEFEGWYEDGVLFSSEATLSIEIFENHSLVAKFVETAAKWVIDAATGMVSGIPEGTTVAEVIAYFQEGDVSVSVATADGKEASDIATGYQLNIGDESYTIVVLGDVNGDGTIDVFDLYSMIAHINSTQTLSGAYLTAGCVCKNEEIDVFDLYSEVSYINSGSFTK